MNITFYKGPRNGKKTYYAKVDNVGYRIINRIGDLRYDNKLPYQSAHIIRLDEDRVPTCSIELRNCDVPYEVKRSLMYFCNVTDGRRFLNGDNHEKFC